MYIVAAAAILFSETLAATLNLFYETEQTYTLQPDNAKLVMLGNVIYQSNCASCHGRQLEGQPRWQRRNPEGLMPAPPHDKSGHTWHHADKLLFELTKFGLAKIAGPEYKSDMPAYSETLSDDEIIAVLSYINSTWPDDIKAKRQRINQAYVDQSK